MNKEQFLKEIKGNIDNNSFHITVVKSSEHPRYAYTIGNLERFGFELILAGNENYLYSDVLTIFNEIAPALSDCVDLDKFSIYIPKLGNFKLMPVHDSWNKKMILGVYDYYNINECKSYQILPEQSNQTKDIPDMSKEWNSQDMIWKWLDDNILWDFNIPRNSKVTTEVDVLFGKKITEIMRWEEDEWEGFTRNGEEVDKDDIRIVPIATLIGIDHTLKSIVNLPLEKGLWREDEKSEWNDWG